MARGRQREGSKSRSKGAAPKRKPATPTAVAGAVGAAPKLSELDLLVLALRTEPGRARAYAELYRLSSGGDLTRDAVSGLTLAKHCIDRFGALDKDRELPERLADLEAQLTEVKTALAGAKGSALRADGAVVPPMEGNAVGDDLATPSPAQGHREPYQS